MEYYRVIVKKSVSKDLKKISKKDVKRIIFAIQALASDPRPPQAIKLSGEDRYRLRKENYRILYSIADEILTVCVVKVGNRRDVYR